MKKYSVRPAILNILMREQLEAIILSVVISSGYTVVINQDKSEVK